MQLEYVHQGVVRDIGPSAEVEVLHLREVAADVRHVAFTIGATLQEEQFRGIVFKL